MIKGSAVNKTYGQQQTFGGSLTANRVEESKLQNDDTDKIKYEESEQTASENSDFKQKEGGDGQEENKNEETKEEEPSGLTGLFGAFMGYFVGPNNNASEQKDE